MAFARAADAPVHVVHLSSRRRRSTRSSREARARGVRATAETCPHYLALTDARYDEPDPLECAKMRHLAAAPLGRRSRRAVGRPGRRRRSTSSPPTTSRTGVAVEKGEAARGVPFDQISNGAPGDRDAAGGRLRPRASRRGRITRRADGRPPRDDARPRRFGLAAKGAIEAGRDADLVLFDPAARRTIRAADLHHTSDYTPYEGLEVAGAVRSVFVRGRAVIRDGRAVGERGFGTFVERGEAGG